jgi:hypothetical protein
MRSDLSRAFVQKVAEMPGLQHGSVRIALWLTAVAERTGGFPVEMYNSDIIRGYNRNGVKVEGMAIRMATVIDSIARLKAIGLLSVEEGSMMSYGHHSKKFTINV